MGFYQPAQLVRDAREHGVEVRHPDINCSDWDCTLEMSSRGLSPGSRVQRAPDGKVSTLGGRAEIADGWIPGIKPGMTAAVEMKESPQGDSARGAVRLGLRLIGGLAEEATKATILKARGAGYRDIPSLWMRSSAPVGMLERLADADAFRSIRLDRRAALWAVKGLDGGALQAGPRRVPANASLMTRGGIQGGTGDLFEEPPVELPETTPGEHVVHDYAAISLSLKAHPVAFFREGLARRRAITSAQHWDEKLAGRRVAVAGLVLVRQRPGTAKGVVFVTLEDETGIVNVVVWPKVFERNRRTVMTAQFLMVRGRIEREGLVIHVIAEELIDLTGELERLGDGTAGLPKTDREMREGSWRPKSRDFH
jgi:error-prone DNA polymerase